MESYFRYGEQEVEYLKRRDARLAEVICALGHLRRPVQHDVFASVVNSILGQQISTKAHATVWQRMQERFDAVCAKSLYAADVSAIQAVGTTFKKAEYIKSFAAKVYLGEFDLDGLYQMPDEQVIRALCTLRGVGKWTAEMILLHCMQRPDVLSFGDLGIRRGLCMIYHHRQIDRARFDKYKRRYSPYGSVASIYIWAVSGGAIPHMMDAVPAKKSAR